MTCALAASPPHAAGGVGGVGDEGEGVVALYPAGAVAVEGQIEKEGAGGFEKPLAVVATINVVDIVGDVGG